MTQQRQRQAEVDQLRAQGQRAFNTGWPIENNPYQQMDGYQWRQGWLRGLERYTALAGAVTELFGGVA